jgi:fibronectin type 3 domain-containing protein
MYLKACAAPCALVIAALTSVGPLSATELFVKPAGSGTTCTQSSPCTLATALATAAVDDAIYLAGGVYRGAGTEVVLLNRTVSLLGGWSGAPAGAVVRDPIAYESLLDGEDARRVVKITGGAPTLDGLTIRRGNASGQVAGCGSVFRATIACGGGVLVASADATLTANLFVDNVADTTSPNPGSGALGGAMHAFQPYSLTVRGNAFRNNLASSAAWGLGGALQVDGARGAVSIAANRFVGNRGTTSDESAGAGGALSIADTAAGGAVTVANNVFLDNIARAAAPSSDFGSDGNAIDAYGGNVAIRGNLIRSDANGCAVRLYYFGGEFVGNTVASVAAFASLFVMEGGGAPLRVTNNVLQGSSEATVRAQASPEQPVVLDLAGNTIVNSGSGSGVRILDNTTATLTNNIVSGHAVGIQVIGNGTVAADHTLFWNNADDGLRGADPIDGDPVFVNAAAGDFHIQEGSAAIGVGFSPAGCVSDGSGTCWYVTTDIDGEARPGVGGVDVGADELAPWRFDFGTPTSPVAVGFARVTHSTAFTPERGFGWNYGTIASRDRGTGDDRRRDFCFTHTGTFAVTIPNGRYRVALTMGDATAGHSQMAVFLENQRVATVNTAGNEFKELAFETAVTDGELTVWLNDEGGSDPNVVINALVIEPVLPVMVDLGTATSPLAAGYTRGTHSSPYSPGAGFGWLGGILQSRDRGTADPLRRDLVFTPRGLLGLFVPNGVYDVMLTLGDATGAHNLMGISVQNAAPDPISTAKNQFVTRRYRTHVADNRLDLLLDDLEGPDVNTVLNAVEVRTPPPLRFDFGTPTSPVAGSYLQVTHTTTYSAQRGFGWLTGVIGSRDRGTGFAQYRDLNFTPDGTFVVDVVPGRYTVDVSLGDASTRHDQMGVYLEGVLVGTYTVSAGDIATTSFSVIVPDGQLTLRLVDQGGTDPNAAINALVIR